MLNAILGRASLRVSRNRNPTTLTNVRPCQQSSLYSYLSRSCSSFDTRIHSMSSLRALPSVDRLLRDTRLEAVIRLYGRSMVTDVIREALDQARDDVAGSDLAIDDESLIDRVTRANQS